MRNRDGFDLVVILRDWISYLERHPQDRRAPQCDVTLHDYHDQAISWATVRVTGVMPWPYGREEA